MKLCILLVLSIAAFAVNCRHFKVHKKASTRNFVDDIRSAFDKSKFNSRKKVCENKKKSGGVPSGKVDSPLEAYGYPNFDQRSKRITVDPYATLLLSNGVKQPIRIGSRDYVISGKAEEIVAFFECFGDYNIIGSELNVNGAWPDNTGEIKIELQNVMPGGGKFQETLFEAMFDMAMDAILKAIDPTGIVASAYEVEQALKSIKDYLPSPSEFIAKAKEIYVLKISKDEKKKRMLYWLKEQDKITRKMWKKPENVKKGEKIIMSLVMYTKPESTVRATYNTAMSTISLNEVAKILKVFFKI